MLLPLEICISLITEVGWIPCLLQDPLEDYATIVFFEPRLPFHIYYFCVYVCVPV